MPIVDRREFGGRFTVKENSQRLANYRYLEIQLMEMIGGWSHTTPQLAFKATFGYHVFDHAQAADLLSERLEQLRAARDQPGAGHRRVRPALRARLAPPRHHRPPGRGLPRAGAAPGQQLRLPRRRHRSADRRPDRAPAAPACGDGPVARRLGPGRARRADPVPGGPAAGARRPGGHRGAAGRLRRRDRPGDRGPLADLPQRQGGGARPGAGQARPRRLQVPQVLARRSITRWSRSRSGSRTSRRTSPSTRPRTSGRWKGSATSSTSSSTARSRRPTAWARCWPSSPICPGRCAWSWRTRCGTRPGTSRSWPRRSRRSWAASSATAPGRWSGGGCRTTPTRCSGITVTNSWAEANLMNTLRQWRTEAEKRGYTRIAELADYLQADERTHVRLATDWIQQADRGRPRSPRRAGQLGPPGHRPHPGLPRLALQGDARSRRSPLHLSQAQQPRRRRHGQPDHRRIAAAGG